MLLLHCITTLTIASVASTHTISRAEPRSLGNWCGSVATPEWITADHERLSETNKTLLPRQSAFTIDTYFHIVANSTRVQDGYLSDNTLRSLLSTLNADYALTFITFNLVGITRTVNSKWALSPLPQDHLAMKTSLRRGTYSTLNLYIRPFIGNAESPDRILLGHCTFPVSNPSKTDFNNDGCMVLQDTVVNRGKTATHEVGHWFGLLHTFEGGCEGGDGVDDTPAEATASEECDLKRNTCPGTGYDPVQNFMDYSPDYCRNHFTVGQSAKMWLEWIMLRG